MDGIGGIHRTKCAGAEAEWQFAHRTIGILSVRPSPDESPIRFTETRPDLSEARDRYPHLTRLWDAVRHDFWTCVGSPIEK